jgi:hypothetical protein
VKIVFGRLAFAAAVVIRILTISSARADVVVQIDKSSQRMSVSVDGAMRYSLPVSTGRSGYGTPSGVFYPQAMARRHFARLGSVIVRESNRLRLEVGRFLKRYARPDVPTLRRADRYRLPRVSPVAVWRIFHA